MKSKLRVVEDGIKDATKKGDLLAERIWTKILFEMYGIDWNKNISNLDEV